MSTVTNYLDFAFELAHTEAERQYGDLVLRSFETMSKEHEDQFRELVEKSSGTVQIWIHSHYDEDKNKSSSEVGYKELRNRAISATDTTAMPVISFIETPLGDPHNLDRYGAEYSKRISGLIYYVPTFQDTSIPYIFNKEDIAATQHVTEVENWDYVGGKLASLGVKKVIVRGRNFEYMDIPIGRRTLAQDIYIEQKGLDPTNTSLPDRCAGAAVVQLEARGFKVLKSRVTHPEQLK